jgi:hypothetical protein
MTAQDPGKPIGEVNGYIMFPSDSNGAYFVRPEHANAFSHKARSDQARTKMLTIFFALLFIACLAATLAMPIVAYFLKEM